MLTTTRIHTSHRLRTAKALPLVLQIVLLQAQITGPDGGEARHRCPAYPSLLPGGAVTGMIDLHRSGASSRGSRPK